MIANIQTATIRLDNGVILDVNLSRARHTVQSAGIIAILMGVTPKDLDADADADADSTDGSTYTVGERRVAACEAELKQFDDSDAALAARFAWGFDPATQAPAPPVVRTRAASAAAMQQRGDNTNPELARALSEIRENMRKFSGPSPDVFESDDITAALSKLGQGGSSFAGPSPDAFRGSILPAQSFGSPSPRATLRAYLFGDAAEENGE